MTLKLEELRVADEIVAHEGVFSCCVIGKTYTVYSHIDKLAIQCEIHSLDGWHYLTNNQLNYFTRFIQHNGGWIGVDLDCTLAIYDGWKGPYNIGAPIAPMVERVKAWIAAGRDVRIFTARVTERETNADGSEHDIAKVRACIEAYCLKHIGKVLPITNIKDWDMMELWDDRAVQVRPNTGIVLADELEAIKNAEAEPKYPNG